MLCSVIGYYLAWRTPITYSAGISFLVNDNKSTANNRILGTQIENYTPIENNKIVEIATSGRIINTTLLTLFSFQGKEDFIGNHLIDIYGFKSQWESESLAPEYEHLRISNIRFNHDNIEKFTLKEHRVISVLNEFLVGNKLNGNSGLMSIDFNSYDKRRVSSGVFNLKIDASKEDLLLSLLQITYDNLVEFCIEESVGRPKRYYESLTIQVDSLKKKLDAAEYNQAYSQDRSKGLISNVNRISKSNTDRKLTELSLEYSAMKKNKEAMELVLNQDTPSFQIINQTFIPNKKQSSKKQNVIVGLLLGAFLSVIFIIGRKIIKDALAE